MSVDSFGPAWKKLYELINDVARQKDTASMLDVISDQIDPLVPADHGVVIAELIEGLPYSRRWPPYTERLAPLFNTHYNRTVPVAYDWRHHRLGPVDWRKFPNSEYDSDFNRPLGIGHTLGIGVCGGEPGCEMVISMHRSRRDSGFTDEDVRLMNLLREPFERIYRMRSELDTLEDSGLFEVEREYGARRLSPREAEVAGLLCRRLTLREIAGLLGISPRTVERHALHIYQKLNVSGRQELTGLIGNN